MGHLFKKLICKFKGHAYKAPYFDNYTLCFCQRCGKEIADRTFDDIETIPDDYDNEYKDYKQIDNKTAMRLTYPDVIENNELLKQYANKILSGYSPEDQQFALNYLSERIIVGEKDKTKKISNSLVYLQWVLESLRTRSD